MTLIPKTFIGKTLAVAIICWILGMIGLNVAVRRFASCRVEGHTVEQCLLGEDPTPSGEKLK